MDGTRYVMECHKADEVQVQGMDVRVWWLTAISPSPYPDATRWAIFVEAEYFGYVDEDEAYYHVVYKGGKFAMLPKTGWAPTGSSYTRAELDVWLATQWLLA
jgi:hypothetical protein